MNSAKNTVVAILLLGVSWGVYRVISGGPGTDPLADLMKLGGPAVNASGDPAMVAPLAGVELNAGAAGPSFRAPSDLPAAAVTPPAAPSPNAPALPPWSEPAPPRVQESQPAPFAAPPPLASAPLTPDATGAPVPAWSAGFADLAPRSDAGGSSPPESGGTSLPMMTATPNPPQTGMLTSIPAAPPPSMPPAPVLWATVEQQVAAGDFRGALQTLTPLHAATAPDDASRPRLNEWLDALAAKVIWSPEHHLDPAPYVVREGDSLESIAAAWNVPWQLVYNVNRAQIANPMMLAPGTRFKKVSGPFRAEIDRQRGELTLYAGELYACRFRLAETAGMPGPGSFRVRSKQALGHQCGDSCVELDSPGLMIHAAGGVSAPGTIALPPADAEDLFNILVTGSEVTIR